jgi:hypothetical protein
VFGDQGAPLIRVAGGQRSLFGVAVDMLPGGATAPCILGSPVSLLRQEVLDAVNAGLTDPYAGQPSSVAAAVPHHRD